MMVLQAMILIIMIMVLMITTRPERYFFKDTSDMYTILGNIADMYTIYDISLETRFSKKHVFKSRKINLDRIDTTFMVLG